MTEPTELLPCPFCGSKATASVNKGESLWSHDVVDWTRVHCTNDDCNAQTEATCEGYEPSAIEVWNRRTPPAVAGEPVAPDFYTACALYKEGGEAGWIPLPGYSNETEHGVKHLVLESARKEGYKGTADGRLLELGWEIRPVYLTPQPTQAQAGAVPLTDEQIKVINTRTLGYLHFARAIEHAHGIGIKDGDSHGLPT